MIDYATFQRIQHLHRVEQLTVAQIALAMAMDARTVRRWLDEPQFRARATCCFSHSLVGTPRELVGVFRRRISWDDGVMREPAEAGAVAFPMNRCCRSGGDVGARAPSVGKCRALVHALSTRSVGRRSVRRTRPHRHRLAQRCSRRSLSVPSDERGVGPHGQPPAGPRPVQLRYESGHTDERTFGANYLI